jgi:hypothetical protein
MQMVEKRGRGRPQKTAQEKLNDAVKAAKVKADKIHGVVPTLMNHVNLDYVALRLKGIKNMDEVEEFYKECVFNVGINYLNTKEKP